MKKSLFFFCPVCIVGIGLAMSSTMRSISFDRPKLPLALEAISCAPPAGDHYFTGADGKFVSLLPGRGNHVYHISTQNDSARAYFNQGLTMYYSYHMKEAVASFKEAARFDSTCAMLYWAQALALGPTYNGGYSYKMFEQVPAVLEKMNAYKASAPAKEQALINAMNHRYNTGDTGDDQRELLNTNYAAQMRQLVKQFPGDVDIKALYIDAVMLLHSWDFWYNNGKPKPWTPELVTYCEEIQRVSPQHPAALHYYIHITEASRQQHVALASADSLINLYPGIAHMVHMSSHEYERIGYYAKGVHANEEADKSLVQYVALAGTLNLSSHVSHYYAVDAYCALSGAMYQKAKQKTKVLRNAVTPDFKDTYDQYLYMFPSLAAVRMGKWQDILQDTTTLPSDWHYASLLLHFARGMAFAKTGKPMQAEKHLSALRAEQQAAVLKVRFRPYMNSAFDCSIIALNVLEANIAFANNKKQLALDAIDKAIAAEALLIYTEPNIWILPARQYKGSFLLEMNQPKAAEMVFRKDLAWNPGNGWSLVGLYQSLQAQKKTAELETIKAQYTHSFSAAEVIPNTAAY